MTAGGRRSPPDGLGLAAAGIVHDANNRLAAIIAAAETALRRPALDAEVTAELRGIRLEAHRAADMLRGLLASEAAIATPLRHVPLDPTVQEISTGLRRLLGPRARLELILGCGVESLLLDPDALHDALLNLAANARDAMVADGVLTLQTALVDLASPLPAVPQPIPPGRYAVIEVRDNGSGIPPRVMQRLGEPFVTTKPPRRGTGLGLNSVRAIMRRHDGFMTLASTPGEGTRVALFLPRGGRWRIGDGRVVLLVEDEPAVRRYEARLLADNGWQVLEAEDGRSALRVLRRAKAERPCLLVCDLALPDQGGPALIRAVRQTCPDLPAIIVSGYAGGGEAAGIDHARFLRKPFRAAELLELVSELVPLTEGPDAGSIA